MLSEEQYLLTKLAEEASEIAQIALKAVVHGVQSKDPRNGKSNVELMNDEINDLIAALGELSARQIYDFQLEVDRLQRKQEVFSAHISSMHSDQK